MSGLPMGGLFDAPTIRCDLTARELMRIRGAVSSQIRYTRNLIAKGKEAEAIGRNQVSLMELRMLMEKLDRCSSS